MLSFALVAWLFSLGPAAANVIYCISDDGHSGFELVGSAERGCASCCHDSLAADEHEGEASQGAARECTDVMVSSPQAVAKWTPVDRSDVAAPLSFLIASPWTSSVGAVRPTRESVFDPPRSRASVRIRHTVLRI